jgi:hypothetical protein
MIKKIVYSLAAIMALFSGFLAAETSSYQIELIVFSQNWPNTEAFDQTISKIEWPNSLTELSAYPKAGQMVLDESVAALSKNSAYQPILHIAWIQAIGENSPGKPVHIQSGDGKINGYVQMQRGQALQLTVDLEYTPGQMDNNGEPYIYRLNEKRKFQLDDVHYLDHPMFGAITKIRPHDG